MRQTGPLPHIGLSGSRTSMYEQADPPRVRVWIDAQPHSIDTQRIWDAIQGKSREPIRVTAEVGEPIRELEGG